MVTDRRTVLVVGAGVSGLTTAWELVARGHPVRMIAELPPEWTTSAKAGASWGPYALAHPRAVEWCKISYLRLAAMAARNDPRYGIRMVDGMEAAKSIVTPPDWAQWVPSFRLCAPGTVPSGYAMAWKYRLPLVDMSRYLLHLAEKLRTRGVETASHRVSTFTELAGQADVIVNCTGLGARDLLDDHEVAPVRGQLVVVKNPGISEFFQEYEDGEDDGGHGYPGEMTYYLPHGPVAVLGGYASRDGESLVPSPELRAGIVERCVAVEPLLAGAEFLADKVGLRPTRTLTRVEHERIGGQHIVHNYGHGGVGLTLSWGCAAEVARLIKEL
ncbi:FAD-dependent oxidoreductase [Hamadaea tsunoensis]|uniref:FAD-dependent oxidoreductase n=1 Tax=Hamadaea tsunoensis TaxID=53368 RepID=UPI000411A880|nr:FAD-dependent oxidoreductase [Hamadaea tsunoensis]